MLFHNEEVSLPGLNFDKIQKWISEVIIRENHIAGEINFIFSSDEYLVEINKEFLKKDYLTDVISFDYSEKNSVHGDIYISTERVKENAEKYNVSLENEFLRVIVHGVLHLLGFDDKEGTEKKIMKKMEDKYLEAYAKGL
ncbi:rRNA maturation RNase YbeY [Bacteroidota bacterium]